MEFIKRFWKNTLKEVSNDPCVTFLSNDVCVDNGRIDPLQEDEIEYIKSKLNIEGFRFNNGWNSFTQQYYLASLENVFVEPDHCIAIKGFSSIIKESVFYEWYKISKRKYLKARIFSFRKIKPLNTAILFDGTVGLNYFHFHNDILTKLNVVKNSLSSIKAVLIISEKLFCSALFQFYYQFEFVKANQWYVLGNNEYLKVSKLYIIKAKQFDFAALNEIANITSGALVDTFTNALASLPFSRRVFINRKEKAGRYLSNFKQLEPVLNKCHFDIVYLEDLRFDQQIALMQAADLIVAIHGAGLTNLIFSNYNNVQAIEIFPINFLPTHYYWLCNSFSIKYKAFYAGNLMSNGGFEIDVERFEKVISRYIDAPN